MNKTLRFKITLSIVFILASLSFFLAFQVGASIMTELPNFRTGYRMIPAFFTYLSPVFIWASLQNLLRPKDKNAYKVRLPLFAGLVAGLSLTSLILTIVYLANKVYPSFVMGTLTPLFPLDLILFDLLFLAYSAFIFTRVKKIKDVLFAYYPRKDHVWLSILKGIGCFIYYFAALYFFGSFLVGFSFADYSNIYFADLIPFSVLMIIPALLYFFLVFEKEKDPSVSIHPLLHISIWTLVTLIFSLSAFIVLLNIPSLLFYTCAPYFAPDYMLSKNLAPFFIILIPLIYTFILTISRYRNYVSSKAFSSSK